MKYHVSKLLYRDDFGWCLQLIGNNSVKVRLGRLDLFISHENPQEVLKQRSDKIEKLIKQGIIGNGARERRWAKVNQVLALLLALISGKLLVFLYLRLSFCK